MADHCGNCCHLDWNNKEKYSSRDKYWCKDKKRYVEPTDTSCDYFLKDRSKPNDGGYTPSGCYITTIIVDILGYEDNCEVLNVLRNFRDNVLKTNIKYLPLLFEYDIIGPIICEYIKSEKNNEQLCLGLLKHFLIPCVNLIKENKFEEAVEVYRNLVLHLRSNYEIILTDIIIPDDYSIEDIGKGRIRQPKTSN